MKLRIVAAILYMLAVVQSASAQDEERPFYRHTLSAGPSAGTFLSSDGPRSSSIGLDYLYRLDRKWELGFQIDFNYGRGFDGYESFGFVPIISYSVTDRLPVFAGAGIEHRRATGSDEFIARVGFEYAIPIGDEGRFALLPGGFVDYVNNEVIASAVLAIGFSF